MNLSNGTWSNSILTYSTTDTQLFATVTVTQIVTFITTKNEGRKSYISERYRKTRITQVTKEESFKDSLLIFRPIFAISCNYLRIR